jgi:IMP dehydrogenase/GMP reductase
MTVLTVPKRLRQKLGEEASEDFIELLNKASEETRDRVIELSDDKFARRLTEEISGLRVEMHDAIGGLRVEMHEAIGGLRSEMHDAIGGLRSEMHDMKGELKSENHETRGSLRAEMQNIRGELRAEMQAIKAEIIKWMFIFWAGQLGAMIALFFAFLRK